MLHLNACPICSGLTQGRALLVKDYTTSGEAFSLVDCDSCGFRFTNPRPNQTAIGRYYESPDYISHNNASEGLLDSLYRIARQWALTKKLRLIRGICSHGSVLDFGCGTGSFLDHLRDNGYLIKGVEPSDVARKAAAPQTRAEVVERLEHIDPASRFDVITLWHVLEHVPDPITTLRSLSHVLSPNGHLVLAVPNRSSWDADHYGPHWAAWDAPRHLSHFRTVDIAALSHSVGLSVKRVLPMWLDAYYIGILSEKYKGAGAARAIAQGFAIGLASNIMSVFSKRPTSSSLYILSKARPL